MTTSFSEIYCLNELIKQDKKLSKLPDYMLNFINFKYLKYGLGFCRSQVSEETDNFIQKLTDIVEPIEVEYEFVSDGIETVFSLTPPPPINSQFYAGVKGIDGIYREVFNYTIDTIANTATFSEPHTANDEILIVAFTIGQFNQDLDYSLQVICAESMNIAFLEENQNNRDLLQQMVHSNAWRIFSQNDHLRGVNFVVRDQRDYVSRLLVDYSFTHTAERMIGLVGNTKF